MKLKRKITLPPAKPILEKEEKQVQKPVNLIQLMTFNRELSSTDPKHHFGLLREWFEKLFNEFPNPDVHPQMIILRIQYELVKRDYTAQDIPIPTRVEQNWIASKHYNIEKLAPSLRNIMQSLVNGTQSKGETMATTAAVKNRVTGKIPPQKQTKETVTQSYIRLFSENITKKLTDEVLAAEMCHLHQGNKKYTAADINIIRNMYNRGKLSGQSKPPLHMCTKVEAWKKPTLKVKAKVKKGK